MNISGIYMIQSKIKPKRVYIGSSVNIKARWKEHRTDLKCNIHHSPKLQNHYNKYGKRDLAFSVLLVCDKEELIEKEQFFIDSYNPYFNICKKAYSTLGTKRSEESRKKISLSKIGNKGKTGQKLSVETKKKLSKLKKGKPTWNTGKKLTKEHKQKISESMKGDKNPMFGKPSPKKGKKGTPSKYKGIKGRYSEEELLRRTESNKRAGEIRKLKNVA